MKDLKVKGGFRKGTKFISGTKTNYGFLSDVNIKNTFGMVFLGKLYLGALGLVIPQKTGYLSNEINKEKAGDQ